jgi:hypothetical protein
MHWCGEHTTYSFLNENHPICICTGQVLYRMLHSIRKEVSLDHASSFTCTPTLTYSKLLSGLSTKFLDVTIMSLACASGVVLGEGPLDRLVVAVAPVRPRLPCLT